MKAEITGKIVRINDTRTSASGYKTRTFWLEETETNAEGREFKNTMEFTLASRADSKFDNTAALDNIGIGSVVRFSFALGGNIWKGTAQKPVNPPRCFNTLRVCSKFDIVGKTLPPRPNTPQTAQPSTASCQADVGIPDEMPF